MRSDEQFPKIVNYKETADNNRKRHLMRKEDLDNLTDKKYRREADEIASKQNGEFELNRPLNKDHNVKSGYCSFIFLSTFFLSYSLLYSHAL